MRKILIGGVLATAFAMISLTLVGKPLPKATGPAPSKAAKEMPAVDTLAAVVTVARVAAADFIETVLVTGSLVPREEILVGAGGRRPAHHRSACRRRRTRVKKGDVLARLVADTLDAQVAQNDAGIARGERGDRAGKSSHRAGRGAAGRERATHSSAPSRCAQVGPYRPRASSTSASRPRAQRTRSSTPPATACKVAEAEKAQVEAQRRELIWRRGRDRGDRSRRRHRQPAHGARRRLRRRGAAEPMFRIIANGRGRARCRGHRDAHWRSVQGGPDRARIEVAGARRRRGQGAPRLARGRQGDAPRPRAHLPRRQSGPARRCLRARHHRDRQRPTASPCPRPRCCTGRRRHACRSCDGNRVETRRIKTGSPRRAWSRSARG